MHLDPSLIHPAVLRSIGDPSRLPYADLPIAERVYVDTLVALVRSQRSHDELAEATAVLNPMLDARQALASADATSPLLARLDQKAIELRDAARAAQHGGSGMAVDLALTRIMGALDDARELTAQARLPA